MTAGNDFEWERMSSVRMGNLLWAATFDEVFLTELLPGPYLTMSIKLSRHENSTPLLISLWDCRGDDSRHHRHVPHYVSVHHSSSSPACDVGFALVVFGPSLQHEHRCRLACSGPCWASMSVVLATVNNVYALWYMSWFSAFITANLPQSLSTKAVLQHKRRKGEAETGSYVYKGSSAAASIIKQHFASAYLCTYNSFPFMA